MEQFFSGQGYLLLFLAGLLASTVIPFGSEPLLVAMLLGGYNPVGAVAAATAGNTLGACATYAIGVYGGPWLIEKVLRITERQQERAGRFYARYGRWTLLLSWAPLVGDPLTLVGGILRVPFRHFLPLVLTGKFVRYVVVAALTLQAAG